LEHQARVLGARAVLIGRPIISGPTINGTEGVSAVLDHLHVELVRAMQLNGTANLKEAVPDLLAR
jgi:isopentenyl diphosphate isomerase/L-lactate dehydrogenase-like FMN-dependent dehydrogenase